MGECWSTTSYQPVHARHSSSSSAPSSALAVQAAAVSCLKTQSSRSPTCAPPPGATPGHFVHCPPTSATIGHCVGCSASWRAQVDFSKDLDRASKAVLVIVAVVGWAMSLACMTGYGPAKLLGFGIDQAVETANTVSEIDAE